MPVEVGTAKGYGPGLISGSTRFFLSPEYPARLQGTLSLLSSEYLVIFPQGKEAGACNWPLISI
jgi:hypothetical protein